MSLPEFENFTLSLDDDALTATLCRPEELNTVTTGMLLDLVALADFLRSRSDIHFLIIAHEGKYFSAGANLAAVREMLPNAEAMRLHQNVAQEMMRRLSEIEQVSFAAIEGSAYGAGVAIAMTCDFRIMSDTAVMNLPETKRGMFLTYGSTPKLVHTVGLSRAKEMIMFAEDYTAAQCQAAGVVLDVVPAGQVLATINAKIATLRTRSWPSIRIAKRVANAAVPPEFGNMIMSEPELVEGTLSGDDVSSRLDAFLKRTQ
ncbi:MAG: enoyl-CoA hydratase/isomerase family protein [Pseudodonghicola sp.]